METKMAPPKTKVAPIVLDLASELSLSDLPLNLRQHRCASKPGGRGRHWVVLPDHVEGTNADQI
jgi:hypothetical protein